jgi:hypothetical protein
MSLRGETVGRAFVKILADGSGLAESIKEEFRKAEPEIRTSGEGQGKAYDKALAKGTKDNDKFVKSMDDKLATVKGRMEANANTIGNDFQKTISDKVTQMLSGSEFDAGAREIGDRVAKNLTEGLNSGDIKNADFFTEINKAVKQIQADVVAADRKAEQEAKAHAAETIRIADDAARRERQTEINRQRQQEADRRASFARQRADLAKFGREMSDLSQRVSFLGTADRRGTESRSALLRDIHALSGGMHEVEGAADHFGVRLRLMGERLVEGSAKTKQGQTALSKFANEFDKVGESVGKVFGAGSRNNFFNVIGNVVGGIASLPGSVAKLVDGAIKGVQAIGNFAKDALGWVKQLGVQSNEAFQEVEQGASGAEEALVSVGKEAAATGEAMASTGPGGMAAGAAAIAVALLTLPIAIGTVISAFSLLLGGLTALASSLAFAVVGALAPLAGALFPIAIGFATIALAMSKWSAENKANSKAVSKAQSSVDAYQKAVNNAVPGTKAYTKATHELAAAQENLAKAQKGSGDSISAGMTRLKAALNGLKTAAAEGIFGKTPAQTQQVGHIIENLATGLNKIKPLFTIVGAGLRGFFADLSGGLDKKGGGFDNFIKVMSTSLPGQIAALGRITQSVFGVIGGLFTSLQPVTGQFLNNVANLVETFNKWINSAKGQSALKDFFDRAFNSASKVWDIIKQLAIDLGKLLDPGQKHGNNILDSLLGQLKQFGDWLDKHPDALDNWFQNGTKALNKVGDITKSIGALFKTLDDPNNRENALKTFDAINFAIGQVANYFTILLTAGKVLWAGLKITFDAILVIFDVFTLHWRSAARDFLGIVSTILGGMVNLVNAGARLPGPIGDAFRKVQGFVAEAKYKVDALKISLNQLPPEKNIVINTSTPGYKDTIANLAAVEYAINKVPKEVTIGINAKIAANANKFLKGSATAQGGVFNGAQARVIGEAGPEAVVPLRRPLYMVDPAVRSLSAIAQGKPMAAGGTVGSGKTINVAALTVITPTEDPVAVAQETINKLVGASLI